MRSLASRLRIARRNAQIPQTHLATRMGVTRSAVAQWEREGGSRPTAANLERLAMELGCSFEWLATGRGTRHVATNGMSQEETAVVLRHFAQDDAEDQMLAEFRKLPPSDQQLVLVIVDHLALRAPARKRGP